MEVPMKTIRKTGMNIWDVIFSMDSSHFPIQRNYLQEPRGSNNPINRLVTQDICHETVDYVRKNITDPYELYVLDYELNYTIRKLADFALYVDLDEFNAWDWEDLLFPPLEDMASYLEKLYRYSDDVFCCSDLKFDIIDLTNKRNEIEISKWDHSYYHNMTDASKFLQAVQYTVENSDFDWKTKAEAFLRASSERRYSPADDETIIYLMSQSIDDEQLEKEAQHRWKLYKKEWAEMFFTDKNPFDGKFSVDRLRFINWDKLSILRPLEPLMMNLPPKSKYPCRDHLNYLTELHDSRDTYNYKVESQHLLSPRFLSDYAKVFSLFRTDLDVDPIRSHLKELIGKLYGLVSGSHDFEYNYTVTDISYLSDLLFSFATNRFQHDILGKQGGSIFSNKTRDDIAISFDNSTVKFTQEVPLITLIALEIHTIFYSRSKGMVSFLHKAKEWLLNNQSTYGYWFDGVNNPEYTTVLVLDALKLISGEDGISFPITTRPHYDKDIIKLQESPVLIIDYISKSLQYGTMSYRPKIKGGKSLVWDFINNLINVKAQGLTLPRYRHIPKINEENDWSLEEQVDYDRIDWKNQYDTISRKLGGNKVLKNFITFNGDSYTLTDNVSIVNNSTIMAKPCSGYVERQ